jgi:hypothetical protein
MDLAEAEAAALARRSSPTRPSGGVANVGQPRDSVEAFEFFSRLQFQSLEEAAKTSGCLLKSANLPPRAFGKSGREHEVFHEVGADRFWKSTFPGQAGYGPFGFFTPSAYLRRLRLSNLVFGDDVQFEGIWKRKAGLSIVTSQPFIQPHPKRFIPSEEEIEDFLRNLGFSHNDATRFWERTDGVELGDTHDRNFIRAPDACIYAIDVQPRLQPGRNWDEVRGI